jgi:tRNA threonylcarbamoyladenosine biosynthesis protein TsaE
MSQEDYIAATLSDLPHICNELMPSVLQYRFVAFDGEMGAGKTTMVREIATQLGADSDIIGSPTFSLVNEYQGRTEKIFHFDFYRLKDIAEAYNIGIEDYFSSGAICLMEWPGLVERLIPQPYLEIKIRTVENKRIITQRVINFDMG